MFTKIFNIRVRRTWIPLGLVTAVLLLLSGNFTGCEPENWMLSIECKDCYGYEPDSAKLIVNLTPEVEFSNACTKSGVFKSWEAKATAGDANAAALVKRYKTRPAIELYDIRKDPLEMNNIAGNPENAEIIRELRDRLYAWMQDCGDKGAQTEMEALEHQGRNRNKKDDAKKKGKKKAAH